MTGLGQLSINLCHIIARFPPSWVDCRDYPTEPVVWPIFWFSILKLTFRCRLAIRYSLSPAVS